MNSPLIRFCRMLAQQLLAVLLGIVLFLTILFSMHDSGESLLIHTVSHDLAHDLAHDGAQPPDDALFAVHMQLQHCTFKLDVQIGQARQFSYQRRLLEV